MASAGNSGREAIAPTLLSEYCTGMKRTAQGPSPQGPSPQGPIPRGPTLQGPNAEMIRAWNGESAERFLRFASTISAGASRHSSAALEAEPPAPGARVIDLGCGFGDTLFELAARVGPTGEVLGVDCSAPLLSEAKRRLEIAGLKNVRVLEADAQHEPLGEGFELCFSRFGCMFFADPVAAFRNIGGALRPGGGLHLLAWRGLAQNPWMRDPAQIASRLLGVPLPAPEGKPGPFAFADADRVRALLAEAGFEQIRIDPLDVDFPIGEDIPAAVALLMSSGLTGKMLRDAERWAELGPTLALELGEWLRDRQGEGPITLPSGSWQLRARWSGR